MNLKLPLVLSDFGIIAELASTDTIEPGYTLVSTSTIVLASAKISADTSTSAITITLPTAPIAGDRIRIKDYKRTFLTNNCIVDMGSKKAEGFLGAFCLNVDGIEADMEFINDTQGWLVRFKL